MTGQPSPEYRRQHDVEAPAVDARAFRQGWRVASRLEMLYRSERITAGELQAAVEYREAWERVLRSTVPVPGAPGRVSFAVADRHEAAWAMLRTIDHIRAAESAIGTLATRLVFSCAVEDRTWADIGRQHRRDPHTVRQWTVDAICRLAPAWSSATRRLEASAAPLCRPAAHRPVAPSWPVLEASRLREQHPCAHSRWRVMNR